MFMTFVYSQDSSIGIYSRQGADYLDSGIVVNNLNYRVIEINKDLTLYLTPYEVSGKTLDNSTTECRVGIVNHQGSRLYLVLQENFTVIGDDDIFTVTIPGEFLNETGDYLVNIDCQAVNKGGYFNWIITVTHTGEELNLPITFSYFFSCLMLFLFCLPILYITINLPSNDTMNEDGEIISINQLKHLRPILYTLMWCLHLAILFIISNYTLMYLNYNLLGNFFFMLFQVMLWTTIICVPIYFVWIIYKLYVDGIKKQLLDRGVGYNTP